MIGGAERRGVRLLLALIVILGSAGGVLLSLRGEVGALAAAVVCLLAVPTVRTLPAGSRAAAWLLAIWAGVTLVIAAAAPSIRALLEGDRARLAIAGAACYLVLAALGFWSCADRRPPEGSEPRD